MTCDLMHEEQTLLAPAPAVSGLCPLLSDRRGVSALLTSQAGSAGPGAAVPCLTAACPALRGRLPCTGVCPAQQFALRGRLPRGGVCPARVFALRSSLPRGAVCPAGPFALRSSSPSGLVGPWGWWSQRDGGGRRTRMLLWARAGFTVADTLLSEESWQSHCRAGSLHGSLFNGSEVLSAARRKEHNK